MSKHYLSVDLDFWNVNSETFTTEGLALFNEAILRGLPTVMVEEHHRLLPNINKFAPVITSVVNVDYHSDLASWDGEERERLTLNEGTWGNFIKGSLYKQFVWSPPSLKCCTTASGYCHGGYKNPFKYGSTISGWKRTAIKARYFPKLKDCVAVGISLSPYWTDADIMKQFLDWFNRITPSWRISPAAKIALDRLTRVHSLV